MQILGPKRLNRALGRNLVDKGGAIDLFSSAPLDLRFALLKTLDPRVTFTRASTGTFVGSDGVLKTAVTNIIWPSEDFITSWGPAAATRVADAGIAPNGTLTADRIESTGGGVFRSGVSVASGISCTYSVYIKHVSGTGVISAIGFERFGAVPLAGQTSFNVLTGTVVSNGAAVTASSITPVGDGWYRVSVRATSTDTTTTITNYAAASGNQFLLWGAQLEQSATVGEYIPTTSTINSAPRFDHNPTTGESLGLLVEEARTNGLTNNTMVGAVAGTPGTLPTGWPFQTSSNGLAVSIVGTGSESGIAYLDWRISGTATAAAVGDIYFGRASALTAQTWTGSSYLRLVAGNLSGVTGATIGLIEETVAQIFITGALYSISLPTTASLITQRPAASRTLTGGATVALLRTNLTFNVSSGSTVDFTIRIGLPQVEQGAFATSAIPTTTAAATRSADVASITGTAFSGWYRQDEGTVYSEGSTFNTGASSCLVSIDDTTSSNRIQLRRSTSASTLRMVSSGGSIDANLTTGTALGANKIATGVSANNQNLVSNGVIATGITSITPMPTVTQAQIGNGPASTIFNGTIRRLTYWPQALPSRLQALTQ